MEQTKDHKVKSTLGQSWDLKAIAYNNIIGYLRVRGINDVDLIQFKDLLQVYGEKLIELYK